MDPTVLDTSPEADAVQRAVWARMGPTRRMELAPQLSDDVRELSIQGVLRRCPHLTYEQAKHEIIRLQLGDKLYEAAFGSR